MNAMLAPVTALIIWSLLIWFLTLATRIPAVRRAKMTFDQVKFPEALTTLPAGVRQFADNYNHLMEQPTIFYALAFTVALSGHADTLNIDLAWAYVVSRFVHSIVQVSINAVVIRLPVFVISSSFLVVMAVREAMALS